MTWLWWLAYGLIAALIACAAYAIAQVIVRAEGDEDE